MNSLYLLIPIALVLIVFALWFLYWAINNGQYDDLDTESKRILFDADVSKPLAGTGTLQKPPEDDSPEGTGTPSFPKKDRR